MNSLELPPKRSTDESIQFTVRLPKDVADLLREITRRRNTTQVGVLAALLREHGPSLLRKSA